MYSEQSYEKRAEFCLFGFNGSLTVFQSYRYGTRMRQVIVFPCWSTPGAGTMTGVPHPVTFSADTWPTSHISQHSPFNVERKQGSYWYNLFTTLGMLQLGMEPTTFSTASGRFTSETLWLVKVELLREI